MPLLKILNETVKRNTKVLGLNEILSSLEKAIKKEDDDPCWDGYEQYGTKDKDGKEVPNCIPIDESLMVEAEYRGKTVTLNKPSSGDVKKYKVYVTHPETGNVVKVNFGDKDMEIKRDDPDARKSFRARHKCDQKTFEKDRHTAGYWSCRFWSSNKTVSELLS